MNFLICAIVICIIFLDQASKFFILQSLTLNEPVTVIGNVFYLTLVYNTGAAFGIFKNQTIFFIIVSVMAIIAIAVYIKKKTKVFFLRDIALALILGGAISNLVDRVRFGYVVDFLDFRIWPVFNLADSAITIGTFLLIFSLLRRGQVSS